MNFSGIGGAPPARCGGRSSVEGRRDAAKLGMTLSLGALVATGMMRGSGARKLHILAGVALIGFSVWHHTLYQPDTGRKSV